MTLNGLYELFGNLNVQKLRMEATKEYIRLMKEHKNIDITFSTADKPGDITIESDGSWSVVPAFADSLNAFQHAYTSSVLTYKYGEKFALVMGDLKEMVTWILEPNELDRNRDLWNNSIASKYTVECINQGISIDNIIDNIFNNVMSDNSSYIKELNENETRKAIGFNNFYELQQHVWDTLGEQITIPQEALQSTDISDMYDGVSSDLKDGYTKPDIPLPDGTDVSLPSHGQTVEEEAYIYTTRPQMLSKVEQAYIATQNKNFDKVKELLSGMSLTERQSWYKALINPRVAGDLINNIQNIISHPSYINTNWNGFGSSLDVNAIIYNMNVSGQIVTQFGYSTDLYGKIVGYPMAIDLGGDGLKTVDINKSEVYFDVDNDGFREKTGWISKEEGILAIDKNGNGKIDNQNEMFGSTSETGFEELKSIDSNNDGVIDANDTDFDKIRVWQDLNENGITDDGELKTLTEAGIKTINIKSENVNSVDNNNIITEKSTVVMTDGTTKDLYDVANIYDNRFSVYGGDYILDADVIDLPWMRGYGDVMDLQLAASQNDNLKTLVKNLSQTTNANTIYNQFDNLVSMWIGENKTGLDMQKTVLAKMLGLDLENMSEFQQNNITNAYNNLRDKLFVNFVAQTSIGADFEFNYNFKTDSLVYNDNTYTNIVTNLLNQDNFIVSYVLAKTLADTDALDINKLVNAIQEKGYGAHLITYVNSGLKLVNGEFQYIDADKPLYVIGGDGDDTITGGNNADIIYGMDGNDLIYGNAGDDFLSGGKGNDTLYGGDGNDTLIGGSGDDSLEGGGGDDTYIYDGDGKDVILDEKWVKVLTQKWVQKDIFTQYEPIWEETSKTLVDGGNDVIVFEEGINEKDITISQSGDDLIFSLNGSNNTLTVKNWYTSPEQRVEKFIFSNGTVISSNQLLNMMSDTNGNDILSGDANDNYIISHAGNDTISSGAGNDIIVNISGDTTYNFNAGDGQDIIKDYSGNDTIALGFKSNQVLFRRNKGDLLIKIKNSEDTLTVSDWFTNENNRIENILFSDGSITSERLMSLITTEQGTASNDIIIGNDEANLIYGYNGNDFIEGKGGNDTINGGAGEDIMKGGAGDDLYYVDNINDKVIENINEGTDKIVSSVTYELPDNVEQLTLSGTKDINGRGNELNNKIWGNSSNNIIDGHSGTNTLYGGLGDDIYIINEANRNDKIIESADAGNDTVKASITYTINQANVENLILTGENNINGNGNNLANYIEGNSGNNILNGAGGNDTLNGGSGVDTLIGGTGDDTYIVNNSETVIIENANEGTDTIISTIDYTLQDNIENLTIDDTNGHYAAGNTLGNTIKGNIGNDTLAGGAGNDLLIGGLGSDKYVFNIGDGIDTIVENDPYSNDIDCVIFGSGINKDNITFTKQGTDLIISVKGTDDKLIIKNSNIAVAARIERFLFTDDNTTQILNSDIYNLSSTLNNNTVYSEFSSLNNTSKSGSIDRNYNNEGMLESELHYNENGNVTVEINYTQTGLENKKEYTYNIDGSLNSTKYYENEDIITTIEYLYDNTTGNISKEVIYKGDTNEILNTVSYIYNNGNLKQKSTFASDTNEIIEKTIYTYNINTGRLLKEQTYIHSDNSNEFLLNKEIVYTFNTNNKLTKIVTKEGFENNTEWSTRIKNELSYLYNTSGQLIRIITKEGSNTEIINEDGSTGSQWSTHLKEEVAYIYNTDGRNSRIVTTEGYYDNSAATWATRIKEQINIFYNDIGLINRKIINTGSTNSETNLWELKASKELRYNYNKEGLITSISVYNYSLNSSGIWAAQLSDKVVYTYDENGRIALAETFTGGLLTESIKYEYIKNSLDFVTKQIIYQGNINNNKVTEYTKIQELVLNDYNNTLTGTDNNDILYGGVQNDYLYSGSGSDTLYGGEGNDTLDGGSGIDLMSGGAGNDTYYVDNENDKIIELSNNGYDSVISNSNYTLSENIEALMLTGAENLNGTGNSLNNMIEGNDGNNLLHGGIGNDTLIGGSGNDILYGDQNNDVIIGGTGNDTLYGGSGNDIYLFEEHDGSDLINDLSGYDIISFGETIKKENIAFYKRGESLVIDYGEISGEDSITVWDQFNTDTEKSIEKIQLNDGTYLNVVDINKVIQDMTSYAVDNEIQLTSIETVKNNAELMNLVASSWHN